MYSMLASVEPSTLLFCFLFGAAMALVARFLRNKDDGYP